MSQDSESKLGKWKLATVLAIVLLGSIAGTYFGIVYFSQSPCLSGTTLRSFAIIANDTSGFNDSRYQPFTINVQKNDCVLITFINDDPVQTHGLGITHYVTGAGVVAQPEQTKTVKFQATETGQFQVGESTASTINAFTDKAGVLNVK